MKIRMCNFTMLRTLVGVQIHISSSHKICKPSMGRKLKQKGSLWSYIWKTKCNNNY